MSLLREVLSDLRGMFLADARLSAALVGIVGLAALLIHATALPPVAGGIALLCGAVAALILGVRSEARRRRPARPTPPQAQPDDTRG